MCRAAILEAACTGQLFLRLHVQGIFNVVAYVCCVCAVLQGYLFVSVIVGEGHDLMPLIIQAIRHDVEAPNPVFNTLAMQCIANIASKTMAEQLGKDIPPVLTNSYVNSSKLFLSMGVQAVCPVG